MPLTKYNVAEDTVMEKWTRILYQPGTPLGTNGLRATACEEHIRLSKNAAEEGMVLLKNEGKLLPLAKGSKIALFGKGTFDYVKGGGGSGDVTVSYSTNLFDGFTRLGNDVTAEAGTVQYYREYVQKKYAEGAQPGLFEEPVLPDELVHSARNFTDTAIISISRFSGEDWDRSLTGQKIAEDRGLAYKSRKLFERGDFYLSEAENAMVQKVLSCFPHVAVVLNVGGMVDTEWFRDDSRIQAVLMAWQGGMEGGLAAAELLCGVKSPCGKLSDTFARDLTDYPGTSEFHTSDDYVEYTEDIYVGYRYFETIPGKDKLVNYPFGFGLSYTTFSWSLLSADEENGEVTLTVSVTNTGNMPGKEVMQVYCAAPQGLLGKPAKVLVAYKKTRLLERGETQLISLSFPVSGMASYDDLGKIEKSCYLLEKGDYHFFVGTSVRDSKQIDFVYTVPENTVTERLSARVVPDRLDKRMKADGSFEELPHSAPAGLADPSFKAAEALSASIGEMPAVRAVGPISGDSRLRKEMPDFNKVADGSMSLDDFVDRLSDDEVAHLLGGQPNIGVANTWGFGNLPQYHVPSAMTADGPAGLRIERKCGVYTTAFPCATCLSCTWDPEITYAVGAAGALEVKENNIAMWLTPAVNIHRSPLCGRNFEYYSEDPYLAGTMAAGMVKGIQSQHISASVKHFALNNKETNRRNSDSRASERAIREIYLKAFEIIVKTARPWCIMSSYNIINGHRSSENADLLTGILREEWKYDGVVTTDWWTYGEHYKEVKAGNDLKMAIGYPESLLDAMSKGLLTREEMNICAKRILKTLLRFD